MTTIVNFTSVSAPEINDAGVIAYTEGGGLVRIWSAGTTTTIADTSGPFSSIGSPALNNLGEVAFLADLDLGGKGIFTVSSPAAKVIQTGGPLFGSTVTQLFFFRGLDDAGQVAFKATLADGRQAIVRADPVVAVPVPEPSSLLLAAGGALAFGLASRRGRFSRLHGRRHTPTS